MPLIQLVYLSEVAGELPRSELIELVARSARRNQMQGICGALYTGGGSFIQVLEGQESAVLQLYGRILADPRHTHHRILTIRSIPERTFTEWGMGHVEGERNFAEWCMSQERGWEDRDWDQLLAWFRNGLLNRAA